MEFKYNGMNKFKIISILCCQFILAIPFFGQIQHNTEYVGIDREDITQIDTILQKEIHAELKKLIKNYNANNVYSVIVNSETGKIISQLSLNPSKESCEKNAIDNEIISYKLLTPVIAFNIIQSYDLDTTFKLITNGVYRISQKTQDSILKWNQTIIDKSNGDFNSELITSFYDSHRYEQKLYSLNESFKNYKFSLVYRALDSLMNKSVFVKFNNMGIPNPFAKKQKIIDLLNGYNFINKSNHVLKNQKASNMVQDMLKLENQKNVYGIFSTVNKAEFQYEISFIGHIKKSDLNYIIFTKADIALNSKNIKFYSNEILSELLSKIAFIN